MSKIKALRVVNLNYNNNAIRMEDERYQFDGENTMISLQNGGGKSVLVQMMMAPLVHKRYRDTPDRKFASYFTTSKPTHIFLEWQLDGGAGYVLVGMTLRKRQAVKEGEELDELEILSFIHEYQGANDYDMESFPVIETVKKERRLKGFNACRQLYEDVRKERGIHFCMYDLTQSNAQRQYFNRLKEYKINYEEWESIIKKINLKESGLSELFKNAKDEAGLIEKWFLPAVETKLNQDQNRIKQFQEMIQKYIVQYKDNQSKIEKKETIHAFGEDAKSLEKMAMEYNKVDQTRRLQEEKLAYLIHLIQDKLEELSTLQETRRLKKQQYEEMEARIQYEKASYELYECMEEMESLLNELGECRKEFQEVESLSKELLRKLHILECARLYGDYKKEEVEVLTLENQLQLKRQDEEKLLPERDELGYNLRIQYEALYKEVVEKTTELEQKLHEAVETQKEMAQKEKGCQQESNRYIKEQAEVEGKIRSYDQAESVFNKQYSQTLQRNILGFYEDDTLFLVRQQEEKNRDRITTTIHEKRERKVQVETERTILDREIQDCSKRQGTVQSGKQQCEAVLAQYEKEIAQRKVAMRYLSLPEEKVLDTDYVVQEFTKKIQSLEQQKRLLEKSLEQQEKEEEKLRTGKVVELPKELVDLMENLDLHYVYGMDYLKQASMGKEQRDALLLANPMLPYSILLSEADVTKLKKEIVPFFTSYPIPIVKREQLAQMEETNPSSMYETKLVSFFYSFNHHLLEEKELAALIEKKQEIIGQCKEKLLRKEEELTLYRTKQGEITYQGVTKERYQNAQRNLEEVTKELEDLEQGLVTMRQKKQALEGEYTSLQNELTKLEKQSDSLLQLITDLTELGRRYEEYGQDCSYLTLLKKKKKKVEEELHTLEQEKEALLVLKDELKDVLRDQNTRKRELEQKVMFYAPYVSGTIRNKELVDLEAKFDAITKTLHGELVSIEENLKKARARFKESESRLNEQSSKYELLETEFNQVSYDSYKTLELEQQIKVQEQEKNRVLNRCNELDKKHAVKEDNYTRLYEELKQQFDTEDLVPKEELVELDFGIRSKEVRSQKELVEHEIRKTDKELSDYEKQQIALAKYEEFVTTQEFAYVEELESYHKKAIFDLSTKEFTRFQGRLQRDYDSIIQQGQEKREEVTKQMELLLRKRCYEDEFFRRPLETLYELVGSPSRLLEQLQINVETFQMVLHKLEVDLAFIGKEKEKLIEMLLDYILEVHSNLGKIDKNSSITIREKPVRMLQLKRMEVEEQESMLKIHLTDYMEELTSSAVARLNENENIEELIGNRITTKPLYDAVVGIHSIQIQLYKIEQQRECKISWSEVSKNSGGEGFLSAFVILTSLLSYMRREDTDLFSTREEGKVIIMDNPFAQTNAAHLLMPLMELARKSNTQLICLSGLGGESIYNCFDNIYVLNLTQSNLQSTVQYVKGEQVKGDVKAYEIKSSRVQVMEQMELLF